MNTGKTFIFTAATFALFSAASLVYAANPDALAASASTREQDLVLAQQLDGLAATAENKAAAHAVMARTSWPKGNRHVMANHCERLVAQYRAEAEAFASQAELHRLAAK